jgi:hypothetical protein
MEPNTCELQNEFLNDNQLSEYQLNFNESAVKRNVLPKTKIKFEIGEHFSWDTPLAVAGVADV